jgi:hypothetical protein
VTGADGICLRIPLLVTFSGVALSLEDDEVRVRFVIPRLTRTAKSRHKMRWVVTILLEYEWRHRTPQSRTEREPMQAKSQQTDVAASSIQSEVLKDNQFRIDAVPPISTRLRRSWHPSGIED